MGDNKLITEIYVSPYYFVDLSKAELPEERRILVLVNPASGAGKALSIFKENAAPLLSEAGINFNMVVTG